RSTQLPSLLLICWSTLRTVLPTVNCASDFHLLARSSSSWLCLSFLWSQWYSCGQRRDDPDSFSYRFRCSDRCYSASIITFWLPALITCVRSPLVYGETSLSSLRMDCSSRRRLELTWGFISSGLPEGLRAKPSRPERCCVGRSRARVTERHVHSE